MNARLTVLVSLVAVVWLAATGNEPRPVHACAPAYPKNKPVEIASETAIIIWDQDTKTQHFIRRASFQTEAEDFGFLVPTPTQPTLEEADDEAFNVFYKLTEPKVITKPRPSGGGCIGCSKSSDKMIESKAEVVKVLEEKRVAGQDAAVLEASDAKALVDWLGKHGYDSRPALVDWLAPYVKAKWKISAFKYAKETKSGKEVAARAVRMTFKAEKPFFPYSEPKDEAALAAESQPRRLLRVYFIGTGRMMGTLGSKGAWPGQVAWANKVPEETREHVLKLVALKKETPPASWWLTEFEDHSSPRPGTDDVFFSLAENQNTLERPPHVRYVSTEAVLWCGAVLVSCWPYGRRWWRRVLART